MKQFEINCPQCSHVFNPDRVFTEEIRKHVSQSLEAERTNLLKEALEEATNKVDLELKDLKTQLEEQASKLNDSKNEHLHLLKKVREAEEKAKNIDLEIEKRVRKQKEIIEDELRRTNEEKHHYELLQRDKKISDMNKVIEELKRKGIQNSSQLIGEVVELDFEMQLRNKYPSDVITPVSTGQTGADIIHDVLHQGRKMGSILWEFKYAKSFSNGWVSKLKENQTKNGASVAIIATNAIPKDFSDIEIVDGIYVVRLSVALALSISLRSSIISLANSDLRNIRKDEKMSLVYDYLTGPIFQRKFTSILDAYKNQKMELDKERKLLTKSWSKREKLLEIVIENSSSMYGELEAIAAADLPVLPELTIGYDDSGSKEIFDDEV